MKNLITILLLMFAFVANAQDITLLHINAKWNTSNDYNLRGIRHAKVLMVNLEDQSAELKSQIKAVPTIVIIGKDGKPKGQWQEKKYKIELIFFYLVKVKINEKHKQTRYI